MIRIACIIEVAFISASELFAGCLQDPLPNQTHISNPPEVGLIQAGTYMMGSPISEPGRRHNEDQHEVAIPHNFYIGRYEVTVAQFRQFCDETGYKTENEEVGESNWRRPFKDLVQEDDHPVLAVSWDDANAYCKWLSDTTGSTWRLPTEAEWEYSCRAGSTTAFSMGEVLTKEVANFSNWDGPTEGLAAIRARPLGTTRVGSYRPNDFGLYDMHGNVFEWCSDVFRDEEKSETSSGRYHTVKGGSWSMSDSDYCRSAHREGMLGGNLMMGFRVVKEIESP